MFKKSILTIMFILSIFIQGCSDDKAEEANSMLTTNEYVLTTTDNQQLIVKKDKGGFIVEGAEDKVIIFDIFATWCPPCRGAASHLTNLQTKYVDDLLIIGLTIEDDITNVALNDFKQTYHADYTLTNSKENRRLINELADTLELGARFPIPTMAIYKDSVLINKFIGAVEEEFIESDIKMALGK